MKSLYLIGSLRNPKIPDIAQTIRIETGLDVFDDWHAAGPEADDEWMRYEKDRARSYPVALLRGEAARHVFEFDKRHLDRCDAAVLVLPAGKSGHLELGYMIGKGKPGFVLFDQEPDRWDVMYQFADDVFFSLAGLIHTLEARCTTAG